MTNKNLKVLSLIFLFMIFFSNACVYSEITSYQKIDGEFGYEINKINEITPYSLARGVYLSVGEKEIIRFPFGERNYNIYIQKISVNDAIIKFPNNREIIVTDKLQKIAIDLNQDGFIDLEFKANIVSYKQLEIYIRQFMPDEYKSTGEYLELFDVILELNKNIIYNSRDLNAFITFKNFGDGTSTVDIVYKITNESGAIIYSGRDIRNVQTEDSIIKNFGFLEVPSGKYKLSAEIYYGKNQTADSEKTFEIVEYSFIDKMRGPLIFFAIIGIIAAVSFGLSKYREKAKIIKKKRLKKSSLAR